MGHWGSHRAGRVLAALYRIGWELKRESASHKTLTRGGMNYTFAFHDGVEIGPAMMARIARCTGLTPDDL